MDTKIINWAQFCIYVAVLLLTAGSIYATITTRLNYVETAVIEQKSDHDLLIALNAKLDALVADMKELKRDIKELRKEGSVALASPNLAHKIP